MQKNARPHPATIILNLGRVFFLLIIPLVRGFFSALKGGFGGWVQGAWFDILVFFFMLLLSVVSWLLSSYYFDEREIRMVTGLFLRRSRVIPLENITTFAVKEHFLLRPFNAVSLSADTLGGMAKREDLSLLLSPKKADAMLRTLKLFEGKPLEQVYRPSTAIIVLLSLLTSSSFGGILFISAFISQSGKLLGAQFSGMLIGTFEEAARVFAFGIPPAAAATGYILLAGWLTGFCLSFVRYKNYTLTRRDGALDISGGIFSKRRYLIRYEHINFIDIRQNVLSKLLRLYSLYLSAVGYGKQKDDISFIIPTEREASFGYYRDRLFPGLDPAPREHAPEKRGIIRFIGKPFTYIFLIFAFMIVFQKSFPLWRQFIFFTGIMAFIPAFFFLLTRFLDYKTGGFSIADQNYVLRYSSGFSLHTVIIPSGNIIGMELRQGFFQKFGRYCDLIIYTKSETRLEHRCRGLVKEKLEKILF